VAANPRPRASGRRFYLEDQPGFGGQGRANLRSRRSRSRISAREHRGIRLPDRRANRTAFPRARWIPGKRHSGGSSRCKWHDGSDDGRNERGDHARTSRHQDFGPQGKAGLRNSRDEHRRRHREARPRSASGQRGGHRMGRISRQQRRSLRLDHDRFRPAVG
jgi:hypothetical protein